MESTDMNLLFKRHSSISNVSSRTPAKINQIKPAPSNFQKQAQTTNQGNNRLKTKVSFEYKNR